MTDGAMHQTRATAQAMCHSRVALRHARARMTRAQHRAIATPGTTSVASGTVRAGTTTAPGVLLMTCQHPQMAAGTGATMRGLPRSRHARTRACRLRSAHSTPRGETSGSRVLGMVMHCKSVPGTSAVQQKLQRMVAAMRHGDATSIIGRTPSMCAQLCGRDGLLLSAPQAHLSLSLMYLHC